MAEVQSTYLFEITPEVAKDMLSRNYEKNRNVSGRWVTQLATMMSDGSYAYDNGNNAIIIDKDGILYDGQHRLLAVIEANKSQVMRINVIDDGEAIFETLDNGRKRGAGNFIGNQQAAVAKTLYCIECGGAPLASSINGRMFGSEVPTRPQVTSYYSEHKELVERLTSISSRMRQTLGKGSRPIFAAFVFIEEWLGDDVSWFVDDFCADGSASTAPLKLTLMRNNGNDRPWMLGTLLQAYETIKSGQRIKKLNQQAKYLDRYTKRINRKRSELL